MATPQEVQERLDEVCAQLGIPGAFSVASGPSVKPMNEGDVCISVGAWPYDYSVDPDKLLANLDPKTMLLMVMRASVR